MKLFERLMNAVTFAEAGLPDVAVEMLHEGETTPVGRKEAGSEIAVQRTRPPISDTLDRLHEAAAFAEAGEHDTARRVIAVKEKAATQILVVSHDDAHSEKLRDYALDLAGRMAYGIVALNVMEVPAGSLFGGENETLAAQFRRRAEQNIAEFRRLAGERGIALSHVVTKGSVEEAIRIAHREHHGIELVVSDPASLGEKDLPAESVSVFALAQHRV